MLLVGFLKVRLRRSSQRTILSQHQVLGRDVQQVMTSLCSMSILLAIDHLNNRADKTNKTAGADPDTRNSLANV
jgi:hypothetical protein